VKKKGGEKIRGGKKQNCQFPEEALIGNKIKRNEVPPRSFVQGRGSANTEAFKCQNEKKKKKGPGKKKNRIKNEETGRENPKDQTKFLKKSS